MKRLNEELDPRDHALELELLRAVQQVRPAEPSKARVLSSIMMTVGAGVAGATIATTTATHATTEMAKSTTLSILGWKAFALGVIVGGAAAGGTVYAVMSHSAKREVAPSMSQDANRASEPHHEAPGLEPSVVDPVVKAQPETTENTERAAHPTLASSSTVAKNDVSQRLKEPAASPSSAEATAPAARSELLSQELRELEAIERLLDSNQGPAALQALDNFDKAHPNAALGAEAQLLRMEGLFKSGRRAEAEAMGRQALTASSSPYRAKVERLLKAWKTP